MTDKIKKVKNYIMECKLICLLMQTTILYALFQVPIESQLAWLVTAFVGMFLLQILMIVLFFNLVEQINDERMGNYDR